MKVYILDNGYIECDANVMVSGTVTGTVQDKTPRVKWIKIPIYAVLIKHKNRNILFDAGCHPEAMNGYWSENLRNLFPYYHTDEQLMQNQLKLAGTSAEEIDTVILSHMHLDHAGNLGLFTNADVYVPKKDFEYALVTVHKSPDPNNHGAYIKDELELPLKNLHLVEKDFILDAGIKVITLAGHTPGLLGLVLHLEKDGTIIFPQDAVYTKDNYGPPARTSGIVYDSLAFFASIEKVRAYEKKYSAKVMFSHDMELFSKMKKAPQYYE